MTDGTSEIDLWQDTAPTNWQTLPDSAEPFTERWYETAQPCRHCRLGAEPNRGPTGATGPIDAPLMLVGEGPGGVEDAYGVPLVGPSGQLLDRALWSVGITRDRVYVTNIVKCRPRNNRTPQAAEADICATRWLCREIALVKPHAIVALGKVALRFFAGRELGIVRSRGQWLQWMLPGTDEIYPVMPTFHPAYLLRLTGPAEKEAKWQVYYDLLAAKEKAAAAVPTYRWQAATPPDLKALFDERRQERAQRR